jgi:hypothetical protein
MMEVRRYSLAGWYSVLSWDSHSMRVLPALRWSRELAMVVENSCKGVAAGEGDEKKSCGQSVQISGLQHVLKHGLLIGVVGLGFAFGQRRVGRVTFAATWGRSRIE